MPKKCDFPALRWFASDHLLEPQRGIARQFESFALHLVETAAGSDQEEITAGLRKLLEAKDCFIRASIS